MSPRTHVQGVLAVGGDFWSGDIADYAFMLMFAIPTVSPLMIPLVYCHIKSFQRASSVGKPWPGGEKRRDGRASHPVEW